MSMDSYRYIDIFDVSTYFLSICIIHIISITKFSYRAALILTQNFHISSLVSFCQLHRYTTFPNLVPQLKDNAMNNSVST